MLKNRFQREILIQFQHFNILVTKLHVQYRTISSIGHDRFDS